MSDTHRQLEVHSESLDGDTNDQPDMVIWSAALPYVPGLVLHAIRRDPYRHGPWIERIEGSIALADISGFTPMAEQLAQAGKEGAEWLTDIMNRYFGRMLHIAHGYGCCNTRFAGDALMLTFMGSGHAARGIAAASAMQRATSRFTTFRAGEHRIRLKMTVGVHSGLFWSAVAGLPELRMQHFILGREASRVAEIQAAATPGELLITSAPLDRVGELCVTEPCVNGYRVLRLSKRVVPQKRVEEEAPLPCSPLDLLAYVPPPIAMAMRSGGQARTIAGEHRKVTIAFINCLGVSELLEQQGADALLDELQRYLSSVLRLSHQNDGFLMDNDIHKDGIKLILVFGAPAAHEQDSANALRFALELEQELEQLKLHFHHRIGINSGFVFCADVGAPYARQYTVMGDAVNLAARLMSSGAVNQILVSSLVTAEAGPSFLADELAPIRVKGKREPVRVCLLKGERGLIPTRQTESLSPLIGREAEMESLRAACREVESGKGRVVLISGSAGIGKSRLVLEFRDHLCNSGWTVCTGNCWSHTAGRPFAAWIQVLSAFFNIAGEPSQEARTGKVVRVIEKLRPDLLEVAPLLNPLLGLSMPGGEALHSLDDETRRRRLFEIIAALFQQEADRKPVALILEDIQHADISSLQLINHIGADVQSFRLLLCLSHRTDRVIQLTLPLAATLSIHLAELSQSASLQLVRTILNQPELSPQVQEAILSKARGNPLFLEQVSASVHHSGALERVLNAPAFKVTQEMASLDIPGQIQNLIMSRIDTLSDDAKDVLRSAAVIGNTFDIATLQHALGPGQRAHLRQRVQDLVRFDLAVREEGFQPPAFCFKHALIQEVAYDSLSFARRRELHHRVGAYIESTSSEQPEAQYEILAHHYSHSADLNKARYFSAKAAEKARAVFSHEEAISYYNRCLITINKKDDCASFLRSHFLECIGDCYELSGHHREAAQSLLSSLREWNRAARRCGAIPTTLPDLDVKLTPGIRECVLCHKLGACYEKSSDFDSSLKWLDKADRALPARRPLQAAKILTTKSVALFRKGLFEEAIRQGRSALVPCRQSGDLGQLAYLYGMLASSYLESGDLKRALRYDRSALRLYDRLGDLPGQALANGNVGISYHTLGYLDLALHYYTAALKAAERMGNPTTVAITHNNIGDVLVNKGHFQEAIVHLEKVVEVYDKLNEPAAVAGLALVNLSRACQRQQHHQIAEEHLRRGIALLRKADARSLLIEAYLQQAELQLETGDTNASLRTGKRALRQSSQIGAKVLEAWALRVMGRIALALGQDKQAEVNLQESAALAKRINSTYETGLTFLALAELYGKSRLDRRSHRRCQRLLKSSVAIFRKMGAEADLSRAMQLQRDLEL